MPSPLPEPHPHLILRRGLYYAHHQAVERSAAAHSPRIQDILGMDSVRSFSPGYGAWEANNEASGEVPAEVEAAVESDFDIVRGVNDFLTALPEGYLATGQIDAFKDALENTDVYLIDAREENEYAEGHIPGAVNIPCKTRAGRSDGFAPHDYSLEPRPFRVSGQIR